MSACACAVVHPCTYCGVIAQSVDHVVPRWLLQRAEGAGLNLSALFRLHSWTVPACIECNSSLGNRIFRTIADRRAFAKAHIRRKYAKYLRIPNWSQDELDALAPRMRSEVIDGLRVRDWTRERLAWSGVGRDADLGTVYEMLSRINARAAEGSE